MIEWFGGQTDRGPVAGESSALFREMLEGKIPCGLETYFEILVEYPSILWPLRKHQRNIEMHAVQFLMACKCRAKAL